MAFETILTETRGPLGLITLHRPQALNALNGQMVGELNSALDDFDNDAGIRCILITGNEKAFAAGADIREMKDLTEAQALETGFLNSWDHMGLIRTPLIAAVAGYCLGGGFEMALATDFIIAADTAKFALPEVSLGILPGVGGSQRLTGLIGKSKSMEMILTGRMIDAAEAERLGVVAKLVPAADLMAEALKTAEKIASFPKRATRAAKLAVNTALEAPLADGLLQERRLIYSCFGSSDQKEGMAAFLEKRKPQFTHQ